ncbi:MAG: DNA repair protein RecO [Deltaproteobacteria bacterium]
MSSIRASHELETEALILRRIDYGESDRVAWLLTPERGRLSAFAPGARKSKRRFPGGLEPFSKVQARLSPPRRGELWRLVEVDLLQTRSCVRESLDCFAVASVACELTADLAREADPVPELYAALSSYLERLGEASRPSLFGLILEALGAAGFAPQLLACARCGASPLSAPTSPPWGFEPAEGGVLCGGCSPRFPAAIRVNARALKSLAELAREGKEPIAEARALLWRHVEQQTGRRLSSRGLLEELGLG